MSENLSRRDLLKASSLLAASFLINPINSAKAENTAVKTINAKDFSPLISQPPKGMSSRQINEHLGLYRKYVSSLNKVIETEKKQGITHDTLINKGFAYGGTILHELYFGNLSFNPSQLNYGSELMKAIEKEYGAYEGLINNFKEAGRSARGWVILGLNLYDGHLSIYGMDSHNEGTALAFIWPLLIMDVYEHAYMIDHGTNKEAYLEAFIQSIDWTIVETRFLQGYKNIKNTTLIV